MNILEAKKLGDGIKKAYVFGGYDKALDFIISNEALRKEISSIKNRKPELINRLKKWVEQI